MDRLRAICLALPGTTEKIARGEPTDPGRFFVPPCLGPRGWIGVRIDRRPDWRQVAALVRDAHTLVRPGRRALARRPGGRPGAVAPGAP